jgi:predicted ATPase
MLDGGEVRYYSCQSGARWRLLRQEAVDRDWNRPVLDERAPFVGRHWERALLERDLVSASHGLLRAATLEGEPGIGKTRLMSIFAEQAASYGMVVLQGGAFDAEGMPPYLPLLEALDPYIQSTSASDLKEQAASGATILGALFPALSARLGPVPAPYPLPQDQARLRLFEAMGAFLREIGKPAGMLLTLDDLHWADPSTLEFLAYTTRRNLSSRIFILVGFRSAEAQVNAALQRTLAELARSRVLTRLALGPLTQQEMSEFAASALAGSVDRSVTDALYTQSEGNPFFAEELLRGWVESSALSDDAGCWQLVGSRGELPLTIRTAVGERLGRLPAVTLDLIQVAALIGRSFHIDVLARVAGRPAEDVEDDLSPSVDSDLLVRRDRGLAFIHDTVRETVTMDIGDARRRRIHGAIAAALETLSDTAPSRRDAELAFHWCRAANALKGVEYAIRAAQQAEARYAFAEAITLGRDALQLMSPDDTRRSEVLLWCGRASLSAGLERDAEAYFHQARDVARRAGETGTAVRSTRGIASARWRQGDLHGAALELDAAITLLAGERSEETVRTMVNMASVKNVVGQQPEGKAIALHALDLATQLGDKRLEAAACRVAGQLTAWGNDFVGGEQLLR